MFSAAAFPTSPALADAHAAFTAALPAMRRVVGFQLRHQPSRRRPEAVASALAACWLSWYGLLRRGRDPVAVGVTGIAFNAVRYVQGGRQFGCGKVGRGSGGDVLRARTQREHSFRVIGLDEVSRDPHDPGRSDWREVLVADRRTTPAEAASFRIDFRAWLESRPLRKRLIAERLAEGHAPG